MRATILIGLLLCLALEAFGQSAAPERKPFVLDTVLVDQGRASAVIVSPESPGYAALAERINDSVAGATGAALPIRKDSDFAALRGELKVTPDTNLIVLGNMDSSGMVTYLCLMGYCTVDTLSPGKGGYMIRTVHDPWGNGANVIVLLGSDLAGVRLAVERFCAQLAKGPTLTIPRIVDVRYSDAMLKKQPSLAEDPSDEEIAKRLREQEAAFRSGVQGGLFNPIVGAGGSYAATGHEGYAKLFRELLFLAERLSKDGQGSFGGPWGAAADFLFGPLITAWDNVEESPSISDEDCAHVVRIIIDYIRYWEGHGYVRGIEKPMLRTNHWTFEGQGWLAAGAYFGKYYDTPESAKWMQMADWCFGHQIKSFKPMEDCGAYQYIILRHMGRYATTRQDFGWYDSGKARMAGDLTIMCLDNLGYQASFGDVGGFSPGSHLGPLQMLATVDRDGRWSWALDRSTRALYGNSPWNYPVHTRPAEPIDLLGLKCMPTDPLFYEHYKGKTDFPQDRTFEKITFRKSFEPSEAYLLLDGINGAYHGHYDGNSILRLTDRNRIWLADSDYIKSLPKYHNTMLIFKDGQSTGVPSFVEREIVAELPSIGMTRTTTHDYGGADWSRNIVWDRDRTFVVIDEMRALSTDDYSFRCYWQTLGSPRLDGSLYRVSQNGPTFSIRNLDGARVRYTDDPVTGQNWKTYKHAEPVVRILQQIRTQKLPKEGRVYIVNVLSTEARGELPVEARRVNDTSVLVGAGSGQALIGVNDGETEIVPGLRTDARLYRLTRDRIALGGVTRLTINGRVLLQSDRPVDNEITLPRDFRLHFPSAMPLPAGSAKQGVADTRKLNSSTQYIAKTAKCTALASHGDTVYVGDTDGSVHALGADGRKRWSFDAGSAVRAVWAGKLDREGPLRIAVGTVKSMVYLLDEQGGLVWKDELPYFKRDASVVYFTTADLSGDGNRALIVGSENWHHYAFDVKGSQLWGFEILHASAAGIGVDLDGDGHEEVIAGSDYYSWRAIKPDGALLWDYKPIGPRANCVVAGDVGCGKPLVLFGGADGFVHAVDGAGKRQWLFNAADEITGMGLMDVDADGVKDIVAGSLSFSVCAVRGDGSRLWRRDVGEPVTCLALDGSGERIWVGTEDGHVLVLDRGGRVTASWTASGLVRRLAAVPGGMVAMTDDGVAVLEME